METLSLRSISENALNLSVFQDPTIARTLEQSNKRDELVPWICDSATGFQLMLTRHPRLIQELTRDRQAQATLRATTASGDTALFDFRFLEIKKILMKANQPVELPDGAQFLIFHDDYLEMPMLIHRHLKAVMGTILAYRRFLSEIERTSRGATILITLGLAFDEFVQSVSLFGRLSEMKEWMSREEPFFPETYVEDWVRDVAAFVENFGAASGRPLSLKNVSESELVLLPQRIDLPREFRTLTQNGLLVEGKDLPDDVGQALESAQVTFAPCDRVLSSTCSLCGGNYLLCSCSELIDGANPVSDLRFAFPYWIDCASPDHGIEGNARLRHAESGEPPNSS